MSRQRTPDSIAHSKRKSSVLLNRERHDLLAWIHPNSVGSYGTCFSEAERAESIHPGLSTTEFCVGTYDNCLQLSASRNGWRAGQVENVERGSDPDFESDSANVRMPRGRIRDDGDT